MPPCAIVQLLVLLAVLVNATLVCVTSDAFPKLVSMTGGSRPLVLLLLIEHRLTIHRGKVPFSCLFTPRYGWSGAPAADRARPYYA